MIQCICIDDSNKPREIPKNKWCEIRKVYHITHIYIHPNQGNIQGCDIYELPLDESCAPYETFKLSRFAIDIKDLEKLKELVRLCSELDNIDFDEIVRESDLQFL
jgi:hypothetical protein